MLTRNNLHKYQDRIVKHIISRKGAAVFVDMGMGKSIATLTAINDLIYDKLEVSKVLIIAPKRVAEATWVDEIEKWEHVKHLTAAVAIGTQQERIKAISGDHDICIINRENVQWLTEQYQKKQWPFDMVVIDELSSFKSPSAKRFKALRKMLPQIERIVGLTGTPAPNGMMDLWAQMYLLDSGKRLGTTMGEYKSRYFVPAYGQGVIVYKYNLRFGAEEMIRKAVSDIALSMSKGDYLDMPKVSFTTIDVRLGAKELKLCEEMKNNLIAEYEGQEITAANAAVLSNKLLQISSGACYNEDKEVIELHTAKIEALKELVEQAGNVLIAYHFKHEVPRILEALKRYKPRVLDGKKDIDDWNAGRIKVLLAHPASAGHGLNIQHGGHCIIWFTPTWSLEHYMQFNARLDRQGQTRPVSIFHLAAQGTIDNRVLSALSGKENMQKSLLNAIKLIASESGHKV